MASALSCPSFFAARTLSPCTNSSKTLVPLSIQFPHGKRYTFRPIARCSPFKLPTLSCKRRFRVALSSEGDAPIKTDKAAEDEQSDEKATENEAAAANKTPDLQALLKTYRSAIASDDEKAVAELENRIYSIEKDTNESALNVLVLSSELKSGKEKYLRLQADFDNFRKRSETERLATRRDAKGEVIKSLLPMVDSFERAKEQLKLETENEKKIDASYQGIYKQLVEIMKALDVSTVTTVGDRFDPSVHEAIAREESGEFEEGIVVREFRRGFLLGGRLLRPAMVKVSAGPGVRKVARTGANGVVQPVTKLDGEEAMGRCRAVEGQPREEVDGKEKDVSDNSEEQREKRPEEAAGAGNN